MSHCRYHSGRDGVISIGHYYYCAQCKEGIEGAKRTVHGGIQPPDCFVWYIGNDKWEKIPGTGCAHFVAHERGIRQGRDDEKCLKGYTFRIPALIAGRSTRSFDGKRVSSRSNLAVNDIYVTPDKSHCGLVVRVEKSREPGGGRKITIRHDSSHLGRVADSDFDEYFHGRGLFYW